MKRFIFRGGRPLLQAFRPQDTTSRCFPSYIFSSPNKLFCPRDILHRFRELLGVSPRTFPFSQERLPQRYYRFPWRSLLNASFPSESYLKAASLHFTDFYWAAARACSFFKVGGDDVARYFFLRVVVPLPWMPPKISPSLV